MSKAALPVLPALEARRRELELCGYCPKLCRAVCPVSGAEARETVTPWGKMSMSWFVARGDVPFDDEHAATAWACTGCYACRERCDHANPVAATLLDARAAMLAEGVAPDAAKRVAAGFAEHERETERAIEPLYAEPGARLEGATALLVGCTYARRHPAEMRDAIVAATALTRGPVRLLDGCCGLPLLLAGDRDGFRRAAERMATKVARSERLVVVDPGCSIAMRRAYPEAGVALASRSGSSIEVELMVELAARSLDALTPLARAPAHPVRWHDPCQLGRGLGCYEPPRSILTRMLGRAPDEFPRHREGAVCSGGGGLLPSTSPETSRRIADHRLEEHAEAGGGEIVTACASSLSRLRSRERGRVSDLVTWIARGLRPGHQPEP